MINKRLELILQLPILQKMNKNSKIGNLDLTDVKEKYALWSVFLAFSNSNDFKSLKLNRNSEEKAFSDSEIRVWTIPNKRIHTFSLNNV